MDLSQGAYTVQVGACGSLNSGIELSNDPQQLLGAIQRVQKGQGALTTYGQRHNSPGKQHGVADRKNGQL
jgi:hypothetical protein